MKKFWDKFVPTVKWLSLAMIAPAVFSMMYKIVASNPHLNSQVFGWKIGGMTGLFMFLFALGSENGGEKRLFYSGWALVAAFTAWMPSFSVTGITIASAIAIWLTMGAIILIEVPAKIRKKQRAAEEALKQKEREVLTARINQLIGDDSRTRALISAIDRLTQYVPEVAERLLTAVAEDAERYVMLRGLETTTTNEVLKQRCSKEASEIAEAARKLCADSTEMALEILTESQSIEADSALGFEYSPKIARVNEEFRHFLEGLRKPCRRMTTNSLARSRLSGQARPTSSSSTSSKEQEER